MVYLKHCRDHYRNCNFYSENSPFCLEKEKEEEEKKSYFNVNCVDGKKTI